MPAVLLNAVGQAAASPAAASLAVTIPSTTALAALIAGAFAGTAGPSRTFTSSGSAWTVDYDDTTKRSGSSAIPASAGTTTVNANNGGTNSDLTVYVAEFLGLKTGGAIQQTVRKAVSGVSLVTDWDTNGLLLTQDSLVICVSLQTSGSAPRSSTTGSGFAALAGTGLTSGNIPNASEGDVMHVSWGNFPSGATVVGAGQWDAVVTTDSWLVAYELVPSGDGTYHLTSDLYF